MNFRLFVLFAMCFVCGAADSAAQAVLPAALPKAEEPYYPLKKCWEYPVEGIGRSAVAAANGTVYVAESEGRIRALNVRTGSVNWVTELGGSVSAVHSVPKLGVAVVTAAPTGVTRSSLRLLSADSGLVKYSVAIDASTEIHLVSSGSRLIVVDAHGSIVALNAQTGETAWQLKLNAKLTSAPAISAENIVIATEDKKLTFISPSSGKVTATITAERKISALAIRENEMVVAGDDRGRVTNYKDASGAVWWQFKSGARVGTILETAEGILIGSFDNFLYLLSKYSGDVRWKRRLDGRIVSLPALIDDRILTASATEENAQLIDMENGKSLDQIMFGENRHMLASPLISEGKFAVFTLVDGIAAYSPGDCIAK